MAKKGMTIEDLARITKNGFDELHALLHAGFNRIANLESNVTELKSDMAELKSDMAELKDTNRHLDARVGEISMWTSKHEDEHDKINLRLKKLEKTRA